MIKIDTSKCVACENCVSECQNKLLVNQNGKIIACEEEKCIACGHCVAVCPVQAISMSDYDMKEVVRVPQKEERIDPDRLLMAMKSRRSVRHFTEEKVEKRLLDQIVEAARFAPTGANRQGVRFFLFTKQNHELTLLTLDTLVDALSERPPQIEEFYREYYRQRWTEMQYEYGKLDIDRLFYHAPAILVIAGNDKIDGALAAANAELMTYALGLGACYIGFFEIAARTEKIRQYLNLNKEEEVFCCLAIGHPDVGFYNTVPRKKTQIEYR